MDISQKTYLKTITKPYELEAYHRIIKAAIFDSKPHITYDYNHTSLNDDQNTPYVFYLNNEIIGSLMIGHYNEEIALLRVVAIDDKFQNQGYGYELLRLAEEIIEGKSYSKILLHARPKAYNFYIKNGYNDMDCSFDPLIFKDSVDVGKVIVKKNTNLKR